MKNLADLIDFYGSDKNVSKYTDSYSHFFEPIRNNKMNVLEIGLGTIVPGAKSSMHDWRTAYVSDYKPGASLRVWQEYFPNANVYGGDIQPDTQFTDERIKTFLFNSQNGTDCNTSLKDLTFDIIIDDGSHHMPDQQITLGYLFPLLKSKGIYIIEDLHTSLADNGYPLYGKSLEIQENRKNTTLFYLAESLNSMYLTKDQNQYLEDNIELINIHNRFNSYQEPQYKKRSITSAIIKK
jgi:hypothetical protein